MNNEDLATAVENGTDLNLDAYEKLVSLGFFEPMNFSIQDALDQVPKGVDLTIEYFCKERGTRKEGRYSVIIIGVPHSYPQGKSTSLARAIIAALIRSKAQ